MTIVRLEGALILSKSLEDADWGSILLVVGVELTVLVVMLVPVVVVVRFSNLERVDSV